MLSIMVPIINSGFQLGTSAKKVKIKKKKEKIFSSFDCVHTQEFII